MSPEALIIDTVLEPIRLHDPLLTEADLVTALEAAEEIRGQQVGL